MKWQRLMNQGVASVMTEFLPVSYTNHNKFMRINTMPKVWIRSFQACIYPWGEARQASESRGERLSDGVPGVAQSRAQEVITDDMLPLK